MHSIIRACGQINNTNVGLANINKCFKRCRHPTVEALPPLNKLSLTNKIVYGVIIFGVSLAYPTYVALKIKTFERQ